MADGPRIGHITRRRNRCSFRFRPSSPTCAETPTTHLLTHTVTWGRIALASCDDHIPIAYTAGELLAEHPHTEPCTHRRARWTNDGCTTVEAAT